MDERLSVLFERFVDSSITEAEKLELSERALMTENQDQLQDLLRSAWDRNIMISDMPDKTAHEILEKILQKSEINHPQPAKNRKLVTIKRIRWIAAAAVLAGAIFGAYTIFFKKPEIKQQTTAVAKINIAPGGNKATLTLGNGTTIILDSQAIGALAQQGNTKIVKTDSGKLSYTVIGQPSTVLPTEATAKGGNQQLPTANRQLPTNNILTTPRGGQYQLLLPDGTKVWLNAASSITYPTAFTGKQRLVKMTGEVYFEVAHDASMPFIVQTGNQLVQDIGTAFNINAYPDEGATITTLIQGKVKILARNQTNTLLPGQQESVTASAIKIDDEVDLEKVIAWRRGLFEFNQMKLPEIMRQISRWYDVDVRYEGPVSNETFGGGISRNLPLSDVLKLLEANGVQFRLDNKTLSVSYQPDNNQRLK